MDQLLQQKPRQNFAGLWNISFGFFGIQIGFLSVLCGALSRDSVSKKAKSVTCLCAVGHRRSPESTETADSVPV